MTLCFYPPQGVMLREFHSAAWQRSRFCTDNACVEAAAFDGDILVRDSKDPDGPVLRFSREEWTSFLSGIHGGDFTFE